MLFAEVNDVIISVLWDEKVKQIFSHIKFSAEVDDSLIEIVHFEEWKQNVVIRLFCGIVYLINNSLSIFLLFRRMLFHHFQVELNQSVEDNLLMR